MGLVLLVACSGGSDDDKSADSTSDADTDADTDADADADADADTDSDTDTDTDIGVEDRFVQGTTAVDVLFVIDDSCSMSDHQLDLSTAFPNFMNFFLGSGIDYHIGVTTTSVDATGGKCGAPGALEGRLVTANGVQWIDEDTPDAVGTFTNMAIAGTGGSGCEKGLLATKLALDDLATTDNAGFLREDAAIHTIILSDEDDHTEANEITPVEFIDWYDGLKPDVEKRQFHAIVCPETDYLSCYETGSRYLSVAEDIGGQVWDIRSLDGGDFLEELGLQAVGITRAFELSQAPQEDTLEVTVELDPKGILELDPIDDWTFDVATNTLTLISYAPDPGAVVVIRYEAL